LPQRLAMHKRRGEETEELASTSQPLSMVPGVHWEMSGAICLPGKPCGLPCPGCCMYSLLSTSMLICCSCSKSRPGSSISCPLSSSLLCRTCSPLRAALSGLCCFCGSFSCFHRVRSQKPPKSSCLFCTLTLLLDSATCLLVMSPKAGEQLLVHWGRELGACRRNSNVSNNHLSLASPLSVLTILTPAAR